MSRALSDAAVLHYSGHAVFDGDRPERSHLILAGRGHDARLDAATLARMRLARLRLVVLAACQTLGVRPDAVGGAAGVAEGFRAAGAAGVVGATWRVDDVTTRPVMLALHDAYARSGDGPAALRNAQLQMLAASHSAHRSPATWAAFHYVGR
jgi:CHAT domain-containing protein